MLNDQDANRLKIQSHSAWLLARGDETLRLDYNLNENSIVLDVGGYHGDWANSIFQKYKCHIHIFEPLPEFAEKIRVRFAGNDKIHVHSKGLGARNEKVLISQENDGSSIYGNKEAAIEVELVETAEFMRSNNLESVDLVKINIEGGEFELLSHLIDSDMIHRFSNIQVQFHDFVKDAPSLKETLSKRLEKTHFLTYKFDFIWENWELLPKQAELSIDSFQKVIAHLRKNMNFQTLYAYENARLLDSYQSELAQKKNLIVKLEETTAQYEFLLRKFNDRSIKGRVKLVLGR